MSVHIFKDESRARTNVSESEMCFFTALNHRDTVILTESGDPTEI